MSPRFRMGGRTFGGGYSRWGTGRRGSPLCVCCCCIFFTIAVLLILGVGLLGSIGHLTGQLEIYPGTTYAISIPTNVRSISVNEISGSIDSYYFSSTPPLSGEIYTSQTDSVYLTMETDTVVNLYMNKGSEVAINWTSDLSDLYFYVIPGESEYTNYVDSEEFISDLAPGPTDAYIDTFLAPTSEIYYFVWGNLESGSNLNYILNFTLKVHDISGADHSRSGTFTEQGITENLYQTIIVKNPSSSEYARFSYDVVTSSAFRYWAPYFFIVLGVVIIIIIVISVRYRKKTRMVQQSTPITSTSASFGTPFGPTTPTPSPVGISIKDASALEQPSSDTKWEPVRPAQTVSGLKYCPACGSQIEEGLLQSLEQKGRIFCTHCGKEIQK